MTDFENSVHAPERTVQQVALPTIGTAKSSFLKENTAIAWHPLQMILKNEGNTALLSPCDLILI